MTSRDNSENRVAAQVRSTGTEIEQPKSISPDKLKPEKLVPVVAVGQLLTMRNL